MNELVNKTVGPAQRQGLGTEEQTTLSLEGNFGYLTVLSRSRLGKGYDLFIQNRKVDSKSTFNVLPKHMTENLGTVRFELENISDTEEMKDEEDEVLYGEKERRTLEEDRRTLEDDRRMFEERRTRYREEELHQSFFLVKQVTNITLGLFIFTVL